MLQALSTLKMSSGIQSQVGVTLLYSLLYISSHCFYLSLLMWTTLKLGYDITIMNKVSKFPKKLSMKFPNMTMINYMVTPLGQNPSYATDDQKAIFSHCKNKDNKAEQS